MSEPLAGAPAGYNRYLSDFCRAAGDVFSANISAGSTWTVTNNSFVFNSPTLLDISCPNAYPTCSGAKINWSNNIVLGYPNIPTVYGTPGPAIFYNPSSKYITINTSNNIEFGTRNGACSSNGTNAICTDPLLLNEPAQSVTAQGALDVFTPTLNTSSFYPTSISPANNAGTTGGPSTDYFGAPETSPATIGAVVQ